MSSKVLSPIRTTSAQREWLEKERHRTGNTFAAIVRGLIQEKINEKDKPGR